MAKTKLERIATIDEQIAQLANQKKQLQQKHKADERKARTRRLIQRGAILESFIPEAETYTEEEIQAALKETIGSDYGQKALRRAKLSHSTDKAPVKPATAQQSAPATSGRDEDEQKEG